MLHENFWSKSFKEPGTDWLYLDDPSRTRYHLQSHGVTWGYNRSFCCVKIIKIVAVKVTPFCPLTVKVTHIFPFYKYKPLRQVMEITGTYIFKYSFPTT